MTQDGRLRILHVLPWVTAGGVERRRLLLAQRMDPARYSQRIACMLARGAMRERIEAAGVPVETFGNSQSPFDPTSHVGLWEIVRRWRPHIIHGAVMEGVILAAVVGRAARVPRVVVEEIGLPTTRTRKGRALFRAMSGMADMTIAVSEAVRQNLITEGGLSPDRVRTVFNGVDPLVLPPAAERAALRARFGIPADAFVVGSVGRMFDVTKRFSDLVRAIAAPSVPADVHLMLAGQGPDTDVLQALAAALGVGDRVHFVGYQNDVIPLFASMDVFALVSARESFGLVIAEAMFAGLPILTTGVGGMGDLVINGHNGLHTRVGDWEAMATAIRRWRTQPALLARMGAASAARAPQFGAERYVTQLEALYEELVVGLPLRA